MKEYFVKRRNTRIIWSITTLPIMILPVIYTLMGYGSFIEYIGHFVFGATVILLNMLSILGINKILSNEEKLEEAYINYTDERAIQIKGKTDILTFYTFVLIIAYGSILITPYNREIANVLTNQLLLIIGLNLVYRLYFSKKL